MEDHHVQPSTKEETPSTGQNQLDVAFEISKLLNCGIDKETLSLCMGLLETGVNPEALADVIKEIRRERDRLIPNGENSNNGDIATQAKGQQEQ
jgi:mitotic-spindle organizing protein 1